MGNLCDSTIEAWPMTSGFEKNLNIARYSIDDIKLSFCNLYQNTETISQASLQQGINNLTGQDNPAYKSQLQLFIQQFQKQNIVIADSDEYHFKTFLAVMYLMSRSSQSTKAQEIFKLYDYSHNGTLNQQELKVMLNSLFQIVFDYSTAIQAQRSQQAGSVAPKRSNQYTEMHDPREHPSLSLWQ